MTASANEIAELKSRIPLSALISQSIKLVKDGAEFRALCPFHHEKTPSFCVIDSKGFYHCFGCGAHGDHVTWLRESAGLRFDDAVAALRDWTGYERRAAAARRSPDAGNIETEWQPILPVPREAPPLFERIGLTTRLRNPKRAGTRREWTQLRPSLVHTYNDATGALLGCVLRVDSTGGKWTPPLTFCRNPRGERSWCIFPFPEPRPLYGLDALAARPLARVIVVEGEKTADAARALLPTSVVVTWPGGTGGIGHVDWSPLANRHVIGIPDADAVGRVAFDGRIDGEGEYRPGVLAMLAAIGARVSRVEPPGGLPKGWDLADAAAEGWDGPRVEGWIADNIRTLAELGIDASPPAATADRKFLPDGPITGRDRAATMGRITAHLLRHFVDPLLAAELVRSWNSARCSPPLEAPEVAALVNKAAQRQLDRETRHVR